MINARKTYRTKDEKKIQSTDNWNDGAQYKETKASNIEAISRK